MGKTRFRWECLAGCALAVVMFNSTRARGNTNTEAIENDTGAEQTELNLELEGDQTGDIDGFINPFGSGGAESTSYDSSTNMTTMDFSVGSGGTAVENGDDAEVGVDESGEIELEGKGWGPEQSSPPADDELPAPTIETTDQATDSNSVFAIIYAQIRLFGGVNGTSQELTEQNVEEGASMNVEIMDDAPNDGGMGILSSGFFLSPTLIPLDDLNTQDYPPSSFSPLPGIPNNEHIDSTEEATSSAINVPLPEPGCVTMLVGAGIALFRRGRRVR